MNIPKRSKPAPKPSQLNGLKNPAEKVRPVDWSWRPARPQRAEDSGPGQPRSVEPDATTDAPSTATTPAPKIRIPLPSQLGPAPKDAVYSVSPEDARPKPRPLRLPPDEAIQLVGVQDVTFEQIVAVIADPEEEWTADVGRSDHFLKDNLCVQVSRAENQVIGVYSRAYALAVRPNLAELRLAAREAVTGKTGGSAEVYQSGVRPRKVSGGQGTRYPTDERELLQLLRAAGFTVTTSGTTHGKITHPEVPGLVLPWASSPSDRRHTRHLVTQVRRVFGIDVRRSGGY